jgi:hypothetical protein
MTPTLRFRVIGERNLLLSMEMSFFVVCPLSNCECKAPKIGMNRTGIVLSSSGCNSSRFSRQISRVCKGITKKDISMLFCIEFLRSLI